MAKKAVLPFCVVALILCSCLQTFVTGLVVQNAEWEAYKALHGKTYATPAAEANARYYYAYNKNLIAKHNLYYQNNVRTFRLDVNQFTDMRFVTFNALFPVTTPPTESFNVSLPTVPAPLGDEFDPVGDLGFVLNIENQGTVCNSGWAYATAKAVELLTAYETGIMTPQPLSGQNLIDCAGRSAGCTNQVPQAGFDYLTQRGQELFLSSEYPNDNTQAQQGMCILPQNPTQTATVRNYAYIPNGDDETMRRFVETNPVVIEFNPTSFEFMHYAEGIFQQPATYRGSHFMTVIGYGINRTSNLNYFIVQNSFGDTWGENGLIRIAYSAARPLARSAIVPLND